MTDTLIVFAIGCWVGWAAAFCFLANLYIKICKQIGANQKGTDCSD